MAEVSFVDNQQVHLKVKNKWFPLMFGHEHMDYLGEKMFKVTDLNSTDAIEMNCRFNPFEFKENTGEVPSYFNVKNQMSKVTKQGVRGTCVAFSMLAQHEYNWNSSRQFSEEYLYWKAMANKKKIPKDPFITFYDAWMTLKNNGVCLLEKWPYNLMQPYPLWGGATPPQDLSEEALNYTVKRGYYIETAKDPKTLDFIKEMIYKKNYVISLQIPVFPEAWDDNGIIRMPTKEEKEKNLDIFSKELTNFYPSLKNNLDSLTGKHPLPWHAICICGWSDHDPYSVPVKKDVEELNLPIAFDSINNKYYSKGRFLFKNSFGPDWGYDGYGSVPYAYFQKWGTYLFAFQSEFGK